MQKIEEIGRNVRKGSDRAIEYAANLEKTEILTESRILVKYFVRDEDKIFESLKIKLETEIARAMKVKPIQEESRKKINIVNEECARNIEMIRRRQMEKINSTRSEFEQKKDKMRCVRNEVKELLSKLESHKL